MSAATSPRWADAPILPANLEVERSILGAILLDNSLYAQAAALHADDFSLDAHRRIYARMRDLQETGRPVDMITLVEELDRSKEVEAIGGVAYLSSLIDGVPERPSIAYYVRIVQNKALLRRVVRNAEAQIMRASAPGADPAIIGKELSQFAEALQQGAGGDQNWRTLFHSYEEFVSAPPLNFAIGGFAQEQGISLIGGLVGQGKTIVMLAMAQAMLEQKPLFDYFSVPRPSSRVVYLVPECAIGPFWARLNLFRLEDHIRADRMLVRTLSVREQVSLNDPRILKAAEGADIFLDTAVRFMAGAENDVEPSRVFAATLFALLGAGARTITGAHHSPKGFETQDRMTLENILRGSGDLGAMLSTAWGLRQIDAETNRIYIENVKARDFQPCEPFVIEGRPHLDEMGHFNMIVRPGEARELRDYLTNTRAGRPANADKEDKLQQALALRAKRQSFQQIAAALGVSKGTVWKWLNEHDQSFPNRFSGNGNDEQRNRDGEDGLSLPPSGGLESFPNSIP